MKGCYMGMKNYWIGNEEYVLRDYFDKGCEIVTFSYDDEFSDFVEHVEFRGTLAECMGYISRLEKEEK